MQGSVAGKILANIGVLAVSFPLMNRIAAADAEQSPDDQILRAIYAAEGLMPQSSGNFHLTLEGMWMYGPVAGHLQTPSGGQPGTTSSNRPTLGQIGINTASIYDAEVLPSFRDHGMYIGGQWIRLSGERRLEEKLISQGETFPAGMDVKSDVK